MKPTVSVLAWLPLLLVQILLFSVFSSPVKRAQHKKHVNKTNGTKITNTSGIRMHERVEKNSEKKTTVTVNGKLLPMAALSATDKNIHVTVQQAHDTTGQLNQLQPQLQPVPPQPLIQEVGLVNSQSNPAGNQATFNSPPIQVPLSTVVQPSGTFNYPALNPGIQAPGTPLNSPPVNSVVQAPGTFNYPANAPAGALNSVLNPVVQQQPPQLFLSPPNLQGSTSSLPGTLNNQQLIAQGQGACGTAALNTIQANQQPATKLVNLGQNSEGQLTYKPLSC